MAMIPMAGVPPAKVSPSPALDALRKLGSASPASGMVANPNRLTESDSWGNAEQQTIEPPPPPSQTPPSEVPGTQIMLQSLRRAYGIPPSSQQHALPGAVGSINNQEWRRM